MTLPPPPTNSRPTQPRLADPGPANPVLRWVVELGPAYLVSLVILPWVIAYGVAWPWQPSTIDLQVYVYAVGDMLAGQDIYATTTPGWNLYFIYPPIAAVLMVPLAFGSYLFWQLVWTFLLVWAQQSVLKRCGVRRGWVLGLVGVAVVVAVEPIRTTLGYGQVNTLLMALVVADLLPDQPSGRSPAQRAGGTKRRIPQGTLIGLAAAIKLTPALFVVFAFLLGKRKLAWTGILSFVAFTALGAVFQWSQTWEFWFGLSGGNTRTASPLYAGNQSLLGVVYRLVGESTSITLLGLAVGGLVALLGTVVASQWWRAGEKVFAVALVGLCTCLASPLSWTHHYVWILPLGVAVVLGRRLPRWVRALGGAWVVWVCVCLPLAVLPYGGGRERDFDAIQQLVANLGPLLGMALVVGLGWQMLVAHRRRMVAAVH
ncbi:MAG: glycosyltransferase 87 family protein [Microlunatus sp.]|nr:glycosyltransferase 87 family protein [Microlunatus sp.]